MEIKKLSDLLANSEAGAEEIKTASDNLMQVSMKIGESVYKQNPENPSSASDQSEPSQGKEKVMDAEFEEVNKDDKKS